jgi:hypothetical protein
MYQLLVAVKSNNRAKNDGTHNRIRGTWGQALRGKATLKFFVPAETNGRSAHLYSSDEIAVDAPDSPDAAVFLTRAICRYFMSKNMDHVLVVDSNSCVFPSRIWIQNYELADYAGDFDNWGDCGPQSFTTSNVVEVMEKCYSWAKNPGYFLSRNAALEIADLFPKESKYILGRNDDVWVGQVLGPLAVRGGLISMPLERPVAVATTNLEETWKEGQ